MFLSPADVPQDLREGFLNDDNSYVVLEAFEPDSGILTITINRPKAANATNDWVYLMLSDAFTRAKANDKVAVVVFTGAGNRFFCGGADLGAGFDSMLGPLKSKKGAYYDPVGRFMSVIIGFPKPLIAAVNGVAVGVGLTVLGLCDMVFSVPDATFSSPFTQLAVTPEFCSSYTFPRIMGPSMASDVLLFGRKLNAQEAKAYHLVHDVLPKEGFLEQVLSRLRPSMAHPHSAKSMHYFKCLLRTPTTVAELEGVHRAEMALLDQRAIGANSDTSEAVRVMRAKAAKNAPKPKM